MSFLETQIQSERLSMRSIEERDAEPISKEYTGSVTAYMHYPQLGSLNSLKHRIREVREEMKQGEKIALVIFDKQEEFLGRFTLENLGSKNIELGGWLKQSAQGKGFGKEAVLSIKLWAEDHLNFEYIIWPCASVNIASRKLAESVGGEVKKEYKKKNANGKEFLYLEYWIPKK